MMDAGRTVMFSSDYPHWDNDNPRVLFRRLDAQLRARIMGGTAAELYGLDHPPRPESLPPFETIRSRNATRPSVEHE
jgi:hypothetical protein